MKKIIGFFAGVVLMSIVSFTPAVPMSVTSSTTGIIQSVEAASIVYCDSRASDGFLVVTTPSGLCVRSGPGTNYSKKGTVPGGQIIYSKETKKGWAKIKTGTYDGYYVCLDYCRPAYLNRQTVTVKTSGSNLNLRKGPSERFGIIAKIPNGSSLSAVYTSSGWLNVVYKTKGKTYTGWVSKSYTRKNPVSVR